jgi:hypothetical protein
MILSFLKRGQAFGKEGAGLIDVTSDSDVLI